MTDRQQSSGFTGALPSLHCDSIFDRGFYFFAALVVVAGFFFVSWCQFVPAHPGVDQNGYLVGGKALARTGTMKHAPRRPGIDEFDPHQFVGRMYVGADLGTPAERYYPKYPLGYPALVALALKLSPGGLGPVVAYWINPVAMSLAVLATFLIARLVASSFVALLAAIAFATSPTTLMLSTNPNSHATAVSFVAWGMYLLLRWWQSGGRVRAALAGLFIGYAATIRYTEGLLIVPLGLVLLFALRPRDRRSWVESLLLSAGWLIPVVILLTYNKLALGTWTGYGPTNESEGFRFEYAIDNWETMFRHLATIGLFWLFPIAIAGMIMMFWWNWRLALVFTTWIVPCIVTYTFYYWAPDGGQTGYLRFFQTILPALATCAVWMLKTLADLVIERAAGNESRQASRWRLAAMHAIVLLAGAACVAILAVGKVTSLATAVWVGCFCSILTGAVLLGQSAGMVMLIGLFAGITAAVQTRGALQPMEFERYQRLMVMHNAEAVRMTAPPGSVLFAADQSLFHHLQFVDEYLLYTGETFNRSYIQNLPSAEPADAPQGLDPGRRDALYNRLKDLDARQLDQAQRAIISGALNNNRRVFFLVPQAQNQPLTRVFQRDARGRPKDVPNPVRRFANAFDAEVKFNWSQPLPRPTPENAGRPRGRRMVVRWDRRTYAPAFQLIELTPKSPTTQPARRQSTRPTTRPATQSRNS